jgi:hypothetical protein
MPVRRLCNTYREFDFSTSVYVMRVNQIDWGMRITTFDHLHS